MGISAVYGTGVYGQSRYGVVHLYSSSSLSFYSTSSIQGLFGASGNSSLEFISSSNIGLGTTTKSNISLNTFGHILGGRAGSTLVTLSSFADLSAQSSKIQGEAFIKLSNPLNNLEGNGALRGDDNLFLFTQGSIFGQAEATGQELVIFTNPRAITNAKRIYATTPLFVIIKKSEIAYKNKNPFYSTWNGKYIDLNKNDNLSSGYLDLLLIETTGPTDLPYEETNQ